MAQDVFRCEPDNDTAIAEVKKFESSVEEGIAMIKAAKEKLLAIPDAEAYVGNTYKKAVEKLESIEDKVGKVYPALVENYVDFVKSIQEFDAQKHQN